MRTIIERCKIMEYQKNYEENEIVRMYDGFEVKLIEYEDYLYIGGYIVETNYSYTLSIDDIFICNIETNTTQLSEKQKIKVMIDTFDTYDLE